MANAITLIVSALCIFAIVAEAHKGGPKHIDIEGRVYCDPCRIQFETKLSRNIEGATVSLSCRDPKTQQKKYEITGKTNSTGYYTIQATGDHSDEICEVSVVKSPDQSCNEIIKDGLNKAQVDLALDEGINQKLRYVNALGFTVKEAKVDMAGCQKVLDDMGYPSSSKWN